MAISTEQVKELRDATGVSVMQCKQALEEAGGDIAQARRVLQRKSAQAAQKKSERSLGAGTVQAYIHNSNDVGTLILLSSETDFVAKNEEFIALARDVAMHITAANPLYIRRDDINDEEMKAITELCRKDVDANKPAEVQTKILQGKIDAYLKERVLLEQEYIKQPGTTVRELIESAIQKFGENIEVSRFHKLSARN